MFFKKESLVITDTSSGDQGKGTTTDAETEKNEVDLIVRTGAHQAAHNAINRGRHHIFAQIGSGSFRSSTHTHLSRYMMVHPIKLLVEAEHLRELGQTDIFSRLTIDQRARITTPFQQSANRLRETARDTARHGSCGAGVGETVADALEYPEQILYAGDLLRPKVLREKLAWSQEFKRRQMAAEIETLRHHSIVERDVRWLTDPEILEHAVHEYGRLADLVRIVDEDFLRFLLEQNGTVIFEGSQGVLLDEWRGFHPFTTWTTCTSENALNILHECGYGGQITRIGVIRAYGVRHGPGPFVTENAELTATIPDVHNGMNEWQREFRIGWFNLVDTIYAVAANKGIEAISLTCLDRLENVSEWPICTAYRLPKKEGLERFFFLDKKDKHLATGIRLGPEHDLEHQAELCQLLFQAQPVYGITITGSFQKRTAQLVELLEEKLRAPVRSLSFGPTTEDKIWRR